MYGKTSSKTNTKIFIASSMELSEDRRAFRELIMEQNNAWHEQGAFLQVIGWEHFHDAISPTRLQDEYNNAIRDCDIFVLLFHSKVGKYSCEEFETAYAQFKATGKPLLYTYYKPADPAKTSSDEDRRSLADFKQRLQDIGHFATHYGNLQELQLKFLQQLYRLAGDGVITFAPPGGAPAKGESPPPLTHIHAGAGAAVANGSNAKAVAQGGMIVEQGGSGTYNTGTIVHGGYFAGTVQAGGDVIGGDKICGKKTGDDQDA